MEQEIKDIMQRLLMNLLQMEYDVLPTKVFKEDKAEYIQALIDTREAEDTDIFINCMAKLHCEHLQQDIDLTETTAKRYLRQLTEFGYLEAHGGNRNKSYTKNDHQCSTQNIDSDINNF